ncbi:MULTISPECIES: TrkH family potassium uptake protein [Bifidobacterium]|uniref:TrkH family potassium uptake protein n=2 Tax=Bifidobacterium reuteri TaxID=983706 RepID=A0A087CSM5_9BIFI|nr:MULTISPECIES: potassium transporter TrkG [Bifidobacterium]KFI86275.1 TrkH family potassium uptake protein [Bifidobacterium reuteri DSM 23975]TPF81163.1 potassium transporter Trk [Bifidobacterium sp. UTCIF-24]TPF85209.1 potassium transporter Trk [Bifidobacterium sp. UTCIF-36]TPF91496.1 potassium transporter Trk [Bifidobacterium sp. UTBIF-56]
MEAKRKANDGVGRFHQPRPNAGLPLPERMLSHPGLLTIVYFLGLVALITVLLLIPAASREPGSTSPLVALFTAVSALSTCGIPVENTATHWTVFGQAIILVGVQLGGLGVMTFAAMITLFLNRKMNISQQLLTAREVGVTKLGEVKGVLAVVFATTFIMEAVTFAVLLPSLLKFTGYRWRTAIWEALFYAVSSFNNTGFTPDASGLYINSWSVGMPVMISAFLGTLGFPVLLEIGRSIRRRIAPRRWSLHTKLTLATTFLLVGVSLLWFLADEWNNPALFANSDASERLRGALSAAVMPRSSGFDLSWVPWVSDETKLYMSVSMFIGGGSSSTAGGIHVTTFAVLMLTMITTFRGRDEVTAFRKRIPGRIVRSAISMTMACALVVFVASMALMQVTGRSLTDALFETCSAFSLGGYTVGVADANNPATMLILACVMFFGRIGPMTIVYAINKTREAVAIHYPDESVSVG